MRLILLTALTMAAFAANSVLNRMALEASGTGPAAFAALRLVAGAAMLWLLVCLRSGPVLPRLNPRGAGSLALYVLGFSFAYVSLETGAGALILFGGVQITMFAGALMGGERVPAARWAGAALAFGGLAWLLWPSGAAPDPLGAGLMAAAALGWGIYSLIGRGATDPLRETGANFVYAVPLGLIAFAALPDALTAQGALLAVASGALTSGLGYALWYQVLPALGAARGALAQLTVPVIALAGGALFLAEPVTWRFITSAALVLGGVALGLAPQRTSASKGS
ncbi:DMT family transporter [Alphaproteobacteria bacterium KMM 3653]|uniref:DMT family transporter n=1 Tax=Harenicola maris TaxID=2841044 RepID=A0AAP2CRE3_9RHOB|nr:DMT family transporter [Harenicola maris]